MNRIADRLATLKPAALVLAGVVAGTLFTEMFRAAPALAQSGSGLPPSEILNAGEQRKQIYTAINAVNDRLAKIEAALNTGIKVKVTEMPAVTVKEK